MLRTLRSLRKNPGFSLIVIGILALGIGANTALFSIINKVLLHPLPFADLDRLVEIDGLTGTGRSAAVLSSDIDYLSARVKAFERTAKWQWQNPALTGVDNPENVTGIEVDEGLFPMLGAAPRIGRGFRADEFQSGAAPVILIGDKLWHQHFHADPNILGRQILLDGKGYTVVGVMGPEFVFPQAAHQFWMPAQASRIAADDLRHHYTFMGKLRRGVSLYQAQRELDAVAAHIPANPEHAAGWHVQAKIFTDQFTGPFRRALLILWGAVGLVLLIACANAANLLLTRASVRQREFAIRASLGAGAFRLARELLVESAVLGIAAGLVGIGLAAGLLRLLILFFAGSSPVPQFDLVSLNGPVLAATLGIVLFTVAICTFPACLDLWRSNLMEGFGSNSRTASGGRAGNRVRSVMTALEVALSIVLLIGAGLMVRSLQRLLDVHLGFEPQHVLSARVSLPVQVKGKDETITHYQRMLREVRTVPGVLAAGIAPVIPLGNLSATTSFSVEGHVRSPEDQKYFHGTYFYPVSPSYFSAMGMRLLRGREFTDADSADATKVAIVSEGLARHYWPGQDPIGKRVSREDEPTPGSWTTVVGMVESTKHVGLAQESGDEVYFPFQQVFLGARYTTLVVRTAGDPMSVVAGIRRRIHDVEPDQPVSEVRTMQTLVLGSASTVRFRALLLEILSGLALGLAVSGLFAMISYMVTQRTREIGIRGALGASPGDIAQFVLGLAMRPVLIGGVIGVAGGLVAAQALRAELFETPPSDPAVITGVVAVLLVASILAALVPAWRAVRIDPAKTLRAE